MSRLLLALALGGASAACALAAVGLVLYGHHPQRDLALQIFAAWGFVAGLACGGLHLWLHGRPVQAPPALPAQALHGLVRAAVASAAAQRQARPGSAADRRPASPVAFNAPLEPATGAAASAAAGAASVPTAGAAVTATAERPAPVTAA